MVNDNLSAFFMSMYNSNNNSLSFLMTGGVPKYIMLNTYNVFVKEKTIIPIESLIIEEKIKLWEDCKLIGIERDKIVDAAKILHTVNFINENS